MAISKMIFNLMLKNASSMKGDTYNIFQIKIQFNP